jgi:hypothetical protein
MGDLAFIDVEAGNGWFGRKPAGTREQLAFSRIY